MAKLSRTTLTDQIFEYIQEQIASGNWKRGEKIPSENELAAQLGVSRMSLRTAILKSNVMGITETRVGEGTFVKKFSMRPFLEELLKNNLINVTDSDINDMRNILQIGSMRLAMKLPTLDDEIAFLEGLYNKMEESCKNNDLDAFFAADSSFHRAICRSCHNEMMYIVYDAIEYLLTDLTKQNVRQSVEYNKSFDMVLNHHRLLIESMKDRDIDKFISLLEASVKRQKVYDEYIQKKS